MDLVHRSRAWRNRTDGRFSPEERRHFFDIPCVVVFKDHSCFVVSENRGIKPSLLALVSLRRQPGRGQVEQPLSSGHETENFQLRKERNALGR